jgi:L-lactate dehydrogenase complex protein LldF
MQHTSEHFLQNSRIALTDAQLKPVLGAVSTFLPALRQAAIDQTPEFESLRDYAVAMKDHVLDHLETYLTDFERAVQTRGGAVHHAAGPDDLNRIVLALCAQAGARKVIKGKSMVGEETNLNDALQGAGIEVLETDLGEYIIQQAGEPPSHIIGPALHKSQAQVAELFRQKHDLGERDLGDVPQMVREARHMLRQRFLEADAGITGANALVVENGAIMLVTNEGNGDLCSTLPRLHIVIAGIEKLVPTMEDASALHRVLCRSATGQITSAYTTFYNGPRRDQEPDGPTAFHVILLDNGRRAMRAGKYRSMLRCIRCGACLNHCPVYRHVGGHAYGWVYPGPMGSVLTPLMTGLERAPELPNACTACGRCEETCPMRIPLPEHLRQLRDDAATAGITPREWRWGIGAAMATFRSPWLYRLSSGIARSALAFLGKHPDLTRRVPLLRGWVEGRSLPAPEAETFMSRWQRRQQGKSGEHRL